MPARPFSLLRDRRRDSRFHRNALGTTEWQPQKGRSCAWRHTRPPTWSSHAATSEEINRRLGWRWRSIKNGRNKNQFTYSITFEEAFDFSSQPSNDFFSGSCSTSRDRFFISKRTRCWPVGFPYIDVACPNTSYFVRKSFSFLKDNDILSEFRFCSNKFLLMKSQSPKLLSSITYNIQYSYVCCDLNAYIKIIFTPIVPKYP